MALSLYNLRAAQLAVYAVPLETLAPNAGAVESEATDLRGVIQEMLLTTTSERQGRAIDRDRGASMEDKKREGYF